MWHGRAPSSCKCVPQNFKEALNANTFNTFSHRHSSPTSSVHCSRKWWSVNQNSGTVNLANFPTYNGCRWYKHHFLWSGQIMFRPCWSSFVMPICIIESVILSNNWLFVNDSLHRSQIQTYSTMSRCPQNPFCNRSIYTATVVLCEHLKNPELYHTIGKLGFREREPLKWSWYLLKVVCFQSAEIVTLKYPKLLN